MRAISHAIQGSPILKPAASREFLLQNEEGSKSGNEPGINCPGL